MSKTVTLSDKMYDVLVKLSIESTHAENSEDEWFDANDAFGGNFDDAYEGGKEDGEVELAKMLLEDMKKEAERQ